MKKGGKAQSHEDENDSFYDPAGVTFSHHHQDLVDNKRHDGDIDHIRDPDYFQKFHSLGNIFSEKIQRPHLLCAMMVYGFDAPSIQIIILDYP